MVVYDRKGVKSEKIKNNFASILSPSFPKKVKKKKKKSNSTSASLCTPVMYFCPENIWTQTKYHEQFPAHLSSFSSVKITGEEHTPPCSKCTSVPMTQKGIRSQRINNLLYFSGSGHHLHPFQSDSALITPHPPHPTTHTHLNTPLIPAVSATLTPNFCLQHSGPSTKIMADSIHHKLPLPLKPPTHHHNTFNTELICLCSRHLAQFLLNRAAFVSLTSCSHGKTQHL